MPTYYHVPRTAAPAGTSRLCALHTPHAARWVTRPLDQVLPINPADKPYAALSARFLTARF